MIIKKEKKTYIESIVKIKFAFLPTRINNKSLLWFERYYQIEEFYNIYRARYKDYKTKEDFYNLYYIKMGGKY